MYIIYVAYVGTLQIGILVLDMLSSLRQFAYLLTHNSYAQHSIIVTSLKHVESNIESIYDLKPLASSQCTAHQWCSIHIYAARSRNSWPMLCCLAKYPQRLKPQKSDIYVEYFGLSSCQLQLTNSIIINLVFFQILY